MPSLITAMCRWLSQIHRAFLLFTVFILAVLAPATLATNLVVNGSFEIILADWQFDGGIEIADGLNHPNPPAADGTNYVGVIDRLWQDIVTLPGEGYYLRFSSVGAPSLRFSGQDIVMTVVSGGTFLNRWKVFEGMAVATGSLSRLEFVSPGSVDDVRVVDLREPVQILNPPSDLSVLAGGTAAFLVNAVGGPPLFYFWRFNDASLVDATNATLTITNATLTNSGSYSVVVSNVSGSLTSTVATLQVEIPPETPLIVSQPSGDTFAAGYAYTLSVVALGTPPLQYQWSFDGVEMLNETNRTFRFLSIQASNAGPYTVRIQNQFGSTLSLAAVLSVTNAQGGASVRFQNNSTGRRPIFDVNGITLLSGANYLAQLYAGTSTTLRPVGVPLPFSSGIFAGYFTGGVTVPIPDLASGQLLNVQTRVWEAAKGVSYEDARAQGGKFGVGPVFSIVGVISPPYIAQNVPMVSFNLRAGIPAFTTGRLEVNARLEGQPIEWMLTGLAGARYLIEQKRPSANWVPLMIVSNSTGTVLFTDTNSSAESVNFYRSRMLD